MSTVLSFGSNTIPIYVYESFSYTISNPAPGTYTLTTSNTPGIPPGYLINNASNVVFATSSNGMSTGTEVFTITARDPSGTIVSTSSNTVTIGAGRFLDASGNSYAGSNYTFYKNEPITPIPLVAPFTISTPTSVPTIPPGLTYTSNASNVYSITGTPLVTVPQSNYLFIGKATGSNLGKIVTSQFGLSISNERILVNLSGSPIISPMTVGSAITPRVFTAQYPPYPSGGTLRYFWNTLPDGIVITDLSGNVQTSTVFTPTDASSTLILKGTPTIAAANSFRDAGITSNIVNVLATRTNPLPQLSNNTPITFGFGETVLFDTPSIPTFYNGVTLDPSATFFRAQTYFGSGSAISNIFSPNLRSDLSINFVSAQGRGYLTGTPTSASTNTFTIRAINSNAVSRDLSATITVSTDVVTFVSPPTPAIDVCYNYILSRPSSLALTGYYPSNVQFQAFAASGKPIAFTSSGLVGTGLSLSNVSANVVQLVGIPDTVTSLGTVTVTASAVGTPATASRTIKLAVLNDVITISDVSALTFIQNRAITPVQLSATTLSERPVTSFTSANIPSGLTLSTTGLITGTPANSAAAGSTFTVNASTGFANQNKTYTYTTIADNAIILLADGTQTVNPSFSGVDFRILSYSGGEGVFTTTSRLVPKQSPSATLTITSNGLVSGDFTSVPVLANEYRYQMTGNVGAFTENAQVNIDTTTPSAFYNMIIGATSNTPQTTPTFPNYSDGSPMTASVQFTINGTENPILFNSPILYTYQAQGNYGAPPGWQGAPVGTGTDADLEAYDAGVGSSAAVVVIGSGIERFTFDENGQNPTFSTVTDISTIPAPSGSTLKGPVWFTTTTGIFPNQNYYIRTLDAPIRSSVITDGNSNWYALGIQSYQYFSSNPIPVNMTNLPLIIKSLENIRVISKSTDNGASWVDISVNLPVISNAVGSLQSEKLYYNRSRLFATRVGSPGDTRYCDTSDITQWSVPTFPLPLTAPTITDMAFSNSTILGIVNNSLFTSSNNGTSWTALTTTGLSSVISYDSVAYKGGQWVLATTIGGSGERDVYSSSNLTDWVSRSGIFTLFTSYPYNVISENGLTWLFASRGDECAGCVWDASEGMPPYLSNVITINNVTDVFASYSYNIKRLFTPSFTRSSNLTISLPFDSLGIAFTSPTQTQYTNWQFVPISNIPVTVSNAYSNSFVYFYESGLPRGLIFTPNAEGTAADISGTSSQYSDAFQRVLLFAVVVPFGFTRYLASLSLNMRTILPTVQKQQTSAGSWTSLVRQYTVVNAAQNSVNSRTVPATYSPLGEFTRPYPPDSVSAPGDPNCLKC